MVASLPERNDILAQSDLAEQSLHRSLKDLAEMDATMPGLSLAHKLLQPLLDGFSLAHSREREMWQETFQSLKERTDVLSRQERQATWERNNRDLLLGFLKRPLWVLRATNDERGETFPLALLPATDEAGKRTSDLSDLEIHKRLLYSRCCRYIEEIIYEEQAFLLDRDYWEDSDEDGGILARVLTVMEPYSWPKKEAFFERLRLFFRPPRERVFAEDAAKAIFEEVPTNFLLEIFPKPIPRLSFSWEDRPVPLPILYPLITR